MSEKFSGDKVALGTAAYMFCSLGFIACYQAGMALFPETYGLDMARISSAISSTSLLAFIASFAYAAVDIRVHAKGMLYINAICIAAGGALLSVSTGLATLVAAFAILGICNAFGTYAVVTEVISNWFVERRADKLAFVMGAGLIGTAAYQFVAGQLFSAMGLRGGFMALGVATAAILVVVTKLLIVGSTPEEVGEVALGFVAEQSAGEASDAAAPAAGTTNLFKDPVFLVAGLARICSAGAVMFVSMYATNYFGEAGVDLGTAATIISVMTLVAALVTFATGKILGAMGTKGFVALVMVGAAASNAAMVAYGASPSWLLIAAICVTYGIGYGASSIINFIVDRLFAPADLASANSKLMGLMYAGLILWLNLAGVIVTNLGFSALYLLMVVMNIAALALYFVALGIAGRRNA